MPRARRFLLPKSFYHIMTRGNNRNVVFKSAGDYQYYLSLISRFKSEHPFDLYHYCLMPNHTHFLIQTDKASDFSTFMKKLNLAYFHHYKREYDWIGHFWQDRFKSKAVGKDAYFIQCGKYIELNPVRSMLVVLPEEYNYSSYKYYSKGEKDPLITSDFMFDEMAAEANSRQMKYQELLIDQIVVESYSRNVWGSDNQRYREQDKIYRKSRKV